MNSHALPIAAVTLLFCAAAAAQDPQTTTQGDSAAPAQSTGTPTTATPAQPAGTTGDNSGAQAEAAPATATATGDKSGGPAQTAQKEMTPEEAAKAAKAGTLEYAKDKIDPNKATAAEIAAHNATAVPEDRITCKKVKPTGSNRPMKLCMTNKQRREMREQTRQSMDASKMDEIGMRAPGPMRGN